MESGTQSSGGTASELLDDIVDALRHASSVLFITGAGMSADSGLPTYWGIGGLYNCDTPEGMGIDEIMSGEMIRTRPELTWKYLAEIIRAAEGASFNRGHEVIAAFEKRFPRVLTITQNVDGFHTLAGAKNVIEMHGNVRSLFCMNCDAEERLPTWGDPEVPPRCGVCKKGILRPRVVLFGEMLPEEASSIFRAETEIGFDVVFSVGTNSLFPYISAPVFEARRRGSRTIEINPGETVVSDVVDIRIQDTAAKTLDAIWARLNA